LQQVKPGFALANTLTMQMSLGGARYRGKLTQPDKLNTFRDTLTERVGTLLGVTAIVHAQCVPLTAQENNTAFQIVGDASATNEKPAAQLRFVSADDFSALQIPFIGGDVFTARDNPQAPPVALVNPAFVREHFNGANPLEIETL
jgi:hypothetical protein